MAVALPFVYGAVAAAAEELLLLLGVGAAAAVAVHEATSAQDDAPPTTVTPCPRSPCPACVPPVGTIQYEIHRCPPSKPHWPCPDDHVHWFKQMQNPLNCECFRKRNALPVTCLPPGGMPALPPGALPL